jgi:hypothetical protein
LSEAEDIGLDGSAGLDIDGQQGSEDEDAAEEDTGEDDADDGEGEHVHGAVERSFDSARGEFSDTEGNLAKEAAEPASAVDDITSTHVSDDEEEQYALNRIFLHLFNIYIYYILHITYIYI